MVRKSQGVIREGHFCFGSLRPRGGRLGVGYEVVVGFRIGWREDTHFGQTWTDGQRRKFCIS